MALETFGAVTDPGLAGPSDANRHANPQLGPEPWFNYPKPTYEQLDEELPPYFEQENVSLGLMLERMTVKGYSDLRGLLEHSYVYPRLRGLRAPVHWSLSHRGSL
jgi:hypothetical protein